MSPVGTAPARMDSSQIYDSEDTEITLGTGKMLALFFALVILCATFFGLGYSMGHNAAKTTAELLPSPGTSRNARTQSAGNGVLTTTAPQPETENKPADQQTTPGANGANGTTPASSANPADQSAASGQTATGTQPAPTAGYFVQVAAVSKQEDAQALVDSLKARQYQAFIADPGADKLFHVQVGPFTDVKEAETMRTRLVNDGYNPILKK
ncbi:MAG TPA: SPOR domain-containing protein [Terriglobales bacterium]|nr:SPOR domain-containing protein [Terriglobales bacterium]